MADLADDLRLVLSAGRTGTLLLSGVLTTNLPNVLAEHEPSPARWEHVLANIRQRWGTQGGLLAQYLLRNRSRRLQRIAKNTRYVEINPMLCPCADLLPKLGPPLHIVHIVRDPMSWTRSILMFKASGPWRRVINLIPYALPYPTPRPQGWSRFSRAEKTLWRWRFCNEMVWNIRQQCASYTILRYEELFSSEIDRRSEVMQKLIAGLQLEIPDDLSWLYKMNRVNAAPKHGDVEEHPPAMPADVVERICGKLAKTLGYVKQANQV